MSSPLPIQLVVENEDGQRRSFPLERSVAGELVLGRDPAKSQVVLDERNVSRRHAKLSWKSAGELLLEDLGSYNGTFVNNQRIKGRQSVKGGDVLRIGDFQLELLGVVSSRAENTQRIVLLRGEEHTHPEGIGARALPSEKTQPDAPQEPERLEGSQASRAAVAQSAPSPLASELTPIDEPTAPTQTPSVAKAPAAPAAKNEGATAHGEETAVVHSPLRKTQHPHLIVINTKFIGEVYRLGDARVTLGRGDDNDLVLLHRSISRHHLEFSNQNQRIFVTDLSSANGLSINGEPYTQSELKDGDVLELGHVRLRFVAAGKPAQLTPGEARLRLVRKMRRPVRYALAGVALMAVLVIGVALGHKTSGTGPSELLATNQSAKNSTGSLSAPALEARALLAQARQAAAEHQYRRAVALANAALALDSTVEGAASLLERTSAEERGESALMRAQAAHQKGNLELAQHELDEVPEDTQAGIRATALKGEVRTGLIDTKLQRARVALAHDHPDEAREISTELETMAPGDAAVEKLREDAEHVRGALAAQSEAQGIEAHEGRRHGDEKTAKSRLGEAGRVLQAGEYYHALELLSRCIEADPAFAPCYRKLGDIYGKLGNPSRAAINLRQYLKLEPKARDAGQVQRQLKQHEADMKRLASD